MLWCSVGHIGEATGGFQSRRHFLKVPEHHHEFHHAFDLVLLSADRGDDRVDPDVLIGDPVFSRLGHQLTCKYAPFCGVSWHSLGTPQEGHKACVILLGQRELCLHPLWPSHDRIDHSLSLLVFISLQPGLDRLHIGRIQIKG